ncbi:MAG: TIGR02300 family protein [Stappiaceae bacterium]
MAKPELGTKRLCSSCGTKYYDLSRDPITCPKCGHIFVLAVAATPAKVRSEPPVKKAEEPEVAKNAEAEDDDADTEVISLEDADAEQMGDDDIADIDDDEEDDTTISDDSNVFLDDDDEDGDADVPGIVVEVDDDDVDK